MQWILTWWIDVQKIPIWNSESKGYRAQSQVHSLVRPKDITLCESSGPHPKGGRCFPLRTPVAHAYLAKAPAVEKRQHVVVALCTPLHAPRSRPPCVRSKCRVHPTSERSRTSWSIIYIIQFVQKFWAYLVLYPTYLLVVPKSR
jgi:hypothetical protein